MKARTKEATEKTSYKPCEKRGVAPLTLRTFYRHLKVAATTEVETRRLGTRAMYGEQLPYPYLEYHQGVTVNPGQRD